MRWLYLTIVFLFTFQMASTAYAQVGTERSTWVFGRNASLKFDKNGIVSVGTSPLEAYQGSACFSDVNGELVLSTNGNAVYNGLGNLIGLLTNKPENVGTPGQLIIPVNDSKTLFYIINVESSLSVKYAKVDLTADGGKGKLTTFNRVLLSNSCVDMTAVKHCFSDAYWLVCSDRKNNFYSFLLKENSISEPVISTVGRERTTTGDLVSNHAGNMLAVSNFSEDWIEVYDFDNRCGTVSNAKSLPTPKSPAADRPDGMSFAPNDLSLYVAWSYQQSNLIQYDLKNWGNYYNCYSSPENINDIALGIDGNLYLNVHESQIPSRRIHQLKNPNIIAGGNRVIEDVATLVTSTNGAFEFPNFISCTSGGGCKGNSGANANKVSVNENRCTDREVYFDAEWTTKSCDSIRWNFDDPTKPDNNSNATKIRRYFGENRIYYVECYLFYCQWIDTVKFEIEMFDPPVFSLGVDTTICAGSAIGIGVNQTFDTLIWSDGAKGQFRSAKPGTYKATILKDGCLSSDEIAIFSYPEIWTELKQEYFICDLENETALLDAGAGFKRYKWTPTRDTTQWIIVEEIGEYLVIVDAFTGCTGDGKTIVKRVCDMQVFVPNAFSPNGDALNEVFKVSGEFILNQRMSIYNLWGEKIYVDEGEFAEWDGGSSPAGTYFYTLEIEGFKDKIPVKKFLKGTILLMK